MIGISELSLAQQDGGLPTTLVAGSAVGESGVSVFSLRFHGGMHFSATTQQHLIWFASPVRIDCRIAGRTLRHEAPAGSLAICPAGIDCGADAEESVDALLVAIDPSQLALAAAEGSALKARLNERLSGDDQGLLDLARTLALENAAGLFFSPSEASRAAGRRYWERVNERGPEREPPVSESTIKAQVAALTAWSQGKGSAFLRLGEIKQPVLVANGHNDVMVPTINAFTMAQKIKDATLIIYPDSGHGFLFQYPSTFTRHVLDFLK
jgi:pimeloyl-ACP methyl ester carboxylesterase